MSFAIFRRGIIDLVATDIRDGPSQMAWTYTVPDFASEYPGLHTFLCHSDCDGEIHPPDAHDLANELEALLPQLELLVAQGDDEPGWYAEKARKLIAGCRRAVAANEPLVFA